MDTSGHRRCLTVSLAPAPPYLERRHDVFEDGRNAQARQGAQREPSDHRVLVSAAQEGD